jgi:NADH:ubiquinone oxidoreductase subunit 4 (subunit M)
MFLEDPKVSTELPVALVPRVMVCILVVPTLVLGVYWEPVIRMAENSVKMLAF